MQATEQSRFSFLLAPTSLALGLLFALTTTNAFSSQAIDRFLLDDEFSPYKQITVEESAPRQEVILDSQTTLVLPLSSHTQQVQMIKRLANASNPDKETIIIGLQLSSQSSGPRAATLIYEKASDGYAVEAVLPMGERFHNFRTYYSHAIGSHLLTLHGASGMHFHEAWIYKLNDGRPELLAANGSATGVELRFADEIDVPELWVGVANWDEPGWNYAHGDPLWNVYTWESKAYRFNDDLSTTQMKTVHERMTDFISAIKER